MNGESLEATKPVEPSVAIDQVILVVNPNSSRIDALRASIEDLRSSHYRNRMTEINTEKQQSRNEAALLDVATSNATVVVFGGDGTVNHTINTIMKHLPDQNINLLVMPAGHAGDISYSVHGSDPLPPPTKILDNARIKQVRPLEVNTALGVKTSQDFALCYVGIGMTARAAHIINSSEFRNLPLYKQLVTAYGSVVALNAILHARPFQIEHNGRFHNVTEFFAANGPRVAKYLPLPIGLEENRFFVSQIEAKYHFRTFANWTGSLLLRQRPLISRRIIRDETCVLYVCDDEYMQVDGESQKLQRDTYISIKQSENEINIVTYGRPALSEAY